MSSLLFARRAAIRFCWGLFFCVPAVVFGQTNYYATNGTEYAIIGSLPGDQVWPDVAVTPAGGFVVWQDNITDGSGWGISARRLDSTLSGTLSTFRVNVQGTNDQENPRVALLKNGGAVFVWQGGIEGLNQHIYARFLTPTNNASSTNYVWLNPTATNDILVNTFTNNFQINPAVAVLNNSNAVVVWASYDEAGSNSLLDVYGQMLSPAGQRIGGEFLINQFTSYNQRTPAVAALANGGFAVAWVSEQEQSVAPNLGTNINYVAANEISVPSVDIYARLYNSNGVAQGGEFLVDTNSLNPCANPDVAAAADGSFMVAWGGFDTVNPTNGWDIYARTFSSAGIGGATTLVNTHLPGNQYAPHLSVIGGDYLVVWTSLGQDGSREGVFGQFVHEDGSKVGGEFLVNTTTVGQQMQPAVASDGVSQFLVVWTGFTLGPDSFDLFAQRYLNVSALLLPIDSLFVYAPFTVSNGVYQPQLQASWPPLLGISVSNYEVYVDGAASPVALTTSNVWTMTAANGLTTNSTHSFRVDYVTTAGFRSPLSPSVSGTTWSGLNWGGIPYEWMAEFFGGYYSGTYHTNGWPSPNQPPPNSPSGSPTLLQLFLSGGIPYEPDTWLQTVLTKTDEGMFLTWNTQPGFTYQVQVTADFASWTNVGGPQFAPGASDSINITVLGQTNAAGYYRVVLLR